MWIVAIARNASKQAAMRSQRTTSRRYFFWSQAKVRSAWNRGTTFLIGRPRFFLVFQTRSGVCSWDPMMVSPRLVSCGPRPLGGHEPPGERKLPQHGAVPIQGVALERKGPQRDGPRHLCVMGTEREGIIQARHIWGRGEVEIECPADRASLAVGCPRPELAGEEEDGPPVVRIDGGQGQVAMQRRHHLHRNRYLVVCDGDEVSGAY